MMRFARDGEMTRPRTIDLCIPAIGAGAHYLDYLISNVYRTAGDPDRIRILVSYHTDEDRAQIEATACSTQITDLVQVSAHNNTMFVASANHAAAINALAKRCTSDVIVFCDYDMAFLMPEWDDVIIDSLFAKRNDLVGVQYANYILMNKFDRSSALGWLNGVPLIKYQNMPNLSFLAMRRQSLGQHFSGGVTSFDRYLREGNIPFRIINSRGLAQENQIPLGAVQWLDTGYEIPNIIATHRLRYELLSFCGIGDQIAFTEVGPFLNLDRLRQPEFFNLQSAPFLCHFKKGSMKSQDAHAQSLFDLFIKNVENYLSKSAVRSR